MDRKRIGTLALIGLLSVALLAPTAAAQEGSGEISPGLIGLAAGIAIAVTGLATGWAQVNIGSAAVGAMAENEELFGQGLILTALPETIVLFGLVIGFLLVQAI